MTLEARLLAFTSAVGADIKLLRETDGLLSDLSTSAKTNLVAAINELFALASKPSVVIDDMAGDGANIVTWSADKIHDSIEAVRLAVLNEVTDGAGAALDTFNEFALAINNDPSFAATIATSLSYRVRYDAAQTLDATQKEQVNANIGSASLVNTGDLDVDLVASYVLAKV